MLKKVLFLSCLTMLTGCWAWNPTVEVPAPADELKKVVETFDRINNPEGIKCRSYMTRITVTPENLQIRMTLTCFGDLEKKRIRTTVTVPGMPPQVDLFDGKNAYSIIPGMQTKVLSGDNRTFLRYSATHTQPWTCLSDEYENMKLDQKSFSVNGKECYRIVAQPAGAPELSPVELFIDKKTFFPVQTRSVTPTEMGKLPCTTDFLKFKKVNGALVGQTVKIRQLNMTILAEVQEVKLNCPIPDDTFNAEKIADEED